MGTLTLHHVEVPGEGVDDAQIEWADTNLRIRNVRWDVQTSREYRVQVWLSGGEVYNAVHVIGSGTANIPGNLSMIEVTDPEGTYFALPPEITYLIQDVTGQ